MYVDVEWYGFVETRGTGRLWELLGVAVWSSSRCLCSIGLFDEQHRKCVFGSCVWWEWQRRHCVSGMSYKLNGGMCFRVRSDGRRLFRVAAK